MPAKTLLKSIERSETSSKSCKQMRRKRFTVRKLELKKSTDFFLIFLSMRKYSIYANGFVYFRESSLDEMRRILLAKIATTYASSIWKPSGISKLFKLAAFSRLFSTWN